MLLGDGGVLTEASLFRTRPNHVHTYFIKYTAAEYATPKPDGIIISCLTRQEFLGVLIDLVASGARGCLFLACYWEMEAF